MPSRKQQVKTETRVDKIVRKDGRLKSTEPSTRGRVKDVTDASQVCNLSDSQSRWDSTPTVRSVLGSNPYLERVISPSFQSVR